MNSRQRLTATLNGQLPDRVPISTYELVGYNSQSWENNDPSYKRLMDAIREKTDSICMWDPTPTGKDQADSEDQRALASNVFLETAYPVEIDETTWRDNKATITQKTLHTPKGDLTQTTKVVDDVHTIWQVEHWCKSIADVEKALSVPYEPVDYDFSDLPRIKNELGNHGIIMTTIPDPLWLAADLMEFGEYTLWAMMEKDHFQKTVEIMHERLMENLRRMLDVYVVDLYRIAGPEYATPPFLPPKLFNRYVIPYVTEIVELIHRYGGKVRFHSHGKVGRVLDMILETGADGLDPCEAPPDGDIPFSEVKQRVGNQMCLFGNIQLKLLEYGTPDQVAEEVRLCMDAAKAGGRFVIMPTAAPINVPLQLKTEENYLRFIDTALEFGKY